MKTFRELLCESLDTVEPATVRPETTDQPHYEVTHIMGATECQGNRKHVSGLVLADGSQVGAPDAIDLIDAGRVLYMHPRPGMPAYEASQALGGSKLVLQVRTCQECGERVLFA